MNGIWSWTEFVSILRDINWLSITVRIILSLLIGGLLGMERGRKNRPAGFRTYILVCLGAAIVMMTNQYVYSYMGGGDPVRMGAQVVSGIGFLGAGTIIVTEKSQVKGITTAAGLWAAACCGLAIGIGFYEGALATGVSVYFVMTLLQHIDKRIHSRSRHIDLYIELEEGHSFGLFIDHARNNGFDITDVQLKKSKLSGKSNTCAVLTAISHVVLPHHVVTEQLGAAPGVYYLEEIGD